MAPEIKHHRKDCSSCGMIGKFAYEKICPVCEQEGYFASPLTPFDPKRYGQTSSIDMAKLCTECMGRGTTPGIPPEKCVACGGKGSLVPRSIDRRAATDRQQPPTSNNPHPNIVDLVRADLEARAVEGEAKYGHRLQPHNGRKALRDAYQEALDLAMYLRQELFEREGK